MEEIKKEIKADQTINLEGLLCPIPVVKVSQAIKSLPVGGILAATATDPGVLADTLRCGEYYFHHYPLQGKGDPAQQAGGGSVERVTTGGRDEAITIESAGHTNRCPNTRRT